MSMEWYPADRFLVLLMLTTYSDSIHVHWNGHHYFWLVRVL